MAVWGGFWLSGPCHRFVFPFCGAIPGAPCITTPKTQVPDEAVKQPTVPDPDRPVGRGGLGPAQPAEAGAHLASQVTRLFLAPMRAESDPSKDIYPKVEEIDEDLALLRDTVHAGAYLYREGHLSGGAAPGPEAPAECHAGGLDRHGYGGE